LCYTLSNVTNIANHKWVCTHFFYCNTPGEVDLILGVIIIVGSVIQQIEKPIEDRLSSSNIELVDIQYRKENQEQVLRILIDSEAGVSLELCSEATHMVKDIIDEKDIFYDHLEVSSPGLDRVLKKDKDFERFTGKKIKVKTLKAYNGFRKVKGILKGFDNEHIKVESHNEVMTIPRDMITIVKLDPDI